MNFRFALTNIWFRILIGFFGVCFSAYLLKTTFIEGVRATLIDPRYEFDHSILTSGADLIPDSPRILARLSEIEQFRGPEYSAQSREHLRQALALSPNNYQFYLQIAGLAEAHGDLEQAQKDFRTAVELAPNFNDTRWMLANFLYRRQRIPESAAEFKKAVFLNRELADLVYQLLWQTDQNRETYLRDIAEGDERLKLKLSLFYARNKRPDEASRIASETSRETLRSGKETQELVRHLAESDRPQNALILWNLIFSDSPEAIDQNLIWNGDLNLEPDQKFNFFDWKFESSVYADARVVRSDSKGSNKELKIAFTGKDTTRLKKEAVHELILPCAGDLQLNFSYRTRNFSTPGDGLRVVLQTGDGTDLYRSAPLGESADLAGIKSDLTTPDCGTGKFFRGRLFFHLEPKYSYESPTRGDVFFSGFSLRAKND